LINSIISDFYRVLDGIELSIESANLVEQINGDDIMDLLSLANKVKNKFTNGVEVCTIMNTKSGECEQNCKYCSQSIHHSTNVEVYPLASLEKILEDAEKTYRSGVKTFGLVTSGWGYSEINDEFKLILKAIDEIYKKFPGLNVCGSFGILSEITAKALAEHKIVEYNHNLQVDPSKYGELVATTHSIDDRINTVKLLKKNGIRVCSGGIIGLGETMQDRIKMAYTLKELDADVIPLNVLIPIKGTPLEGAKSVTVAEIAKTFAIFRLINPTKTIKFAAGRETKMKDFQGLLMLSGANGILTGGYLTTRGRTPEEDNTFIDELNNF